MKIAPRTHKHKAASRLGRPGIVGFIALLGLAATACSGGSSTSTSTTTPRPSSAAPPSTAPGELTGLGATDAAWNARHTEVQGPGPGGTYGPFIPAPGGGENQWTSVNHEGGHVIGFVYSMPDRTSEAAAKQAVMAQLPPDSTTTMPITEIGPNPSTGNTCAIWNLRSPTLARVLGAPPIVDTAGDIGVVLSTVGPNGTRTYNRNNVNTASVGAIAVSTTSNC